MDPNTLASPGSFDLPSPTPEQGADSNSAVQNTPEAPPGERSTELPNSAQPAPASPVVPVAAQVPSSLAPPPTSPPTTAVPIDDTPLMADDVDLIEKEWVNKAKAIVQRTKDDPRVQNREINKIKADYIKKRYNKEIRVSEE